jgi:hypothetical protein
VQQMTSAMHRTHQFQFSWSCGGAPGPGQEVPIMTEEGKRDFRRQGRPFGWYTLTYPSCKAQNGVRERRKKKGHDSVSILARSHKRCRLGGFCTTSSL